MPVIKIDLSQEVLEKIATLANRNMVATRVMAVEIIEKHLAAQQSAQRTLLTPCPACCSVDKECPICNGTCVKPQSG